MFNLKNKIKRYLFLTHFVFNPSAAAATFTLQISDNSIFYLLATIKMRELLNQKFTFQE